MGGGGGVKSAGGEGWEGGLDGFGLWGNDLVVKLALDEERKNDSEHSTRSIKVV